MSDLTTQVIPHIEKHRLPGWEPAGDLIMPHYAGYSLANLPASVLHWFGIPGRHGQVPLADEVLNRLPGPYQQVIVLLLDGLGFHLFEQFRSLPPWDGLLSSALYTPLTSITPSTTSSALTTLWTGAPPAEHGTVGYEMFLKEYGLIANTILHSPASYMGDPGSLAKAGFLPEDFLPVRTLGPLLQRANVASFAFQPVAIAGSGLSRMLLQDVQVLPYRSVSDLEISLRDFRPPLHKRSYVYVYWSEIDTLSHRFGPGDERVQLEFQAFSAHLARLIERMQARRQGNTLFIITADHGLITTPVDPHLELRHHPDFLDLLTMLPSGENRLAYLYVHPGQTQAVRDYVETAWPGQFELLERDQALALGLFGHGTVYSRLRDRIGDLIAVPLQGAYWWWADRDNPMLGRHGGFSRAEMLIPFMALEL